MRIPDIAPTLSDTQMLDFCRQGFLVLESVVADEINERVCEFIGRQPYAGGNGGAFEDKGLLEQAWFVEHVLLNPQAAGAARSLLGKNASLPTWMYNHQARCPKAAQTWHRDGCSRYGHQVNHLQVFYYPQDTPLELGPTEVLPGSHFLFNLGPLMGHYGTIKGSVPTAAPAGTILLTAYPIWHRRAASTTQGLRHMLKYLYWRREPPRRDWLIEPDFALADLNDLENSLYGRGATGQDQFQYWHDIARMFYWLAGMQENFAAFLGADGWPMGHPPRRKPEGFGAQP